MAERGNGAVAHVKVGRAIAVGAKGIKKKRPRLGKVADAWQSRLIASFGVVRRRDVEAGSALKSSRYAHCSRGWSILLTIMQPISGSDVSLAK